MNNKRARKIKQFTTELLIRSHLSDDQVQKLVYRILNGKEKEAALAKGIINSLKREENREETSKSVN